MFVVLTVPTAIGAIGPASDLSGLGPKRLFAIKSVVGATFQVYVGTSADTAKMIPLLVPAQNGSRTALVVTANEAIAIDAPGDFVALIRKSGKDDGGAQYGSVTAEPVYGSAAGSVLHEGGDSFGAPYIAGSIDDQPVALIQHAVGFLEATGTNVNLGNTAIVGALNVIGGGGGIAVTARALTDISISSTGVGARTGIAGGEDGVAVTSEGPVTLQASGANAVDILPSGGGAGQAGAIRMRELAANGSNVAGWQAQDVLAADVMLKLPAALPTLRGQTFSSGLTGETAFGKTIQSGQTTLLATGISPAISASISATSRITFGPTNASGSGIATTARYIAATADRVNGANGTGSFKLTAINAAGAPNANDTSTLDWIVVDGPDVA